MQNSPTAPLEIGRANVHDLRIRWADGHESVYPAADFVWRVRARAARNSRRRGRRARSGCCPREFRPFIRYGSN